MTGAQVRREHHMAAGRASAPRGHGASMSSPGDEETPQIGRNDGPRPEGRGPFLIVGPLRGRLRSRPHDRSPSILGSAGRILPPASMARPPMGRRRGRRGLAPSSRPMGPARMPRVPVGPEVPMPLGPVPMMPPRPPVPLMRGRGPVPVALALPPHRDLDVVELHARLRDRSGGQAHDAHHQRRKDDLTSHHDDLLLASSIPGPSAGPLLRHDQDTARIWGRDGAHEEM